MEKKRENFWLAIIPVAFSLIFFLSILVYAQWNPPSASPPSGNVPPPINVGSSEQIKNGTIGASYFKVLGWDAVYGSFDTGGGANRPFHLIGTYHGWDPYGVYIAGYNSYNNSSVSQAKKVYIGGGGTERVTIDLNTGNVGIGTTAPSYKLHVVGNVGATAYYYTSDIAKKTDIYPLENSLEKILKLQGVSFVWKDTGQPSIGLIAQDVEKVFPEVVSGKEGEKTIDYGRLIAPLIEAIKEQQKEIEQLKAKISDLEARLK